MLTSLYALIALFIVLLIVHFFRPVNPLRIPGGPAVHKSPATGYPDALERIEKLRAAEARDDVRDVCQTKLFSHGERADDVLVFLHGFSTCPEQFNELGKRLYELGYNVLIPRAPYHGLSDRLTRELSKQRAEEMVTYANRTIDIACGLGRRVTVLGISGGGTITCWLAQNRPEVDIAIPISALLGIGFVPASLTQVFARIFYRFPDFYLWWDARTRAANPSSTYYAYPGYSLHALSEVLRLGVSVRQQAHKHPPAAGKIVMVINESEPDVSNAELENILQDWQKNPGKATLRAFRFEPDLKLPHDIITPETPGLQVEVVYERLIDLIRSETSAPEETPKG